MKLYSYFRSSAAYRARIALNLKGLPFDTVPIHLLKGGGEQHGEGFRAVNPQGRVPVLELGSGEVLLQSLAIIEYLDEVYPEPALLPKQPLERACVRAVAEIIACDIHPLNNVGPLNYLRHQLAAEKAAVQAWYRHWIEIGFEAVEALIGPVPMHSEPLSVLPTSASCLKSPMPAVSTCRSTVFRRSSQSMRLRYSFQRSTLPGRNVSPMPNRGGRPGGSRRLPSMIINGFAFFLTQ